MTLDEIAVQVSAGWPYKESWELFRVQHFPGREHEDAVTELMEWALKRRIEPDFFTATSGPQQLGTEIIFVLLTAR